MTQINYTNTIPEIKRAYVLFRRKYALPRMLAMTVLLLATIIFGFDFIIKNPSGYVGYILTILCSGMLISLWSRPFLAVRRLISTIEALGKDEKYIARFFDDRIEIDTEIVPLETETIAISGQGIDTIENPEVLEEVEEDLIQAETSVYRLGSEQLYSAEDSEIFCLFVNKALIHIFPKRCMSEEQTEAVRTYLKDKGI
ncbi:MAG: YcxB family protein [Oscillospiraceae bacterium]|jgi:hypothetical protein|nr:YcxB family protein [Oscillospiraceae bacterium]